MAYTPTSWTTGDTITATKLNKMEQGIANAGSALIVTLSTQSENTWVMDKTYAEIYEAYKSGIPCYVKLTESSDSAIDSQYRFTDRLEPIVAVFKYDMTYRIFSSSASSAYFSSDSLCVPAVHVFAAATSADYPVFLKNIFVNTSALTVSGTP